MKLYMLFSLSTFSGVKSMSLIAGSADADVLKLDRYTFD